MKARWTFRCYPTSDQKQHLVRTFGCVRYVWNWALQLRSDGWCNSERISYPETDRRLTLLKQQPETGEAVGIDFGINRLSTLSGGEKIANPKHGAKEQRRPAHHQKRLARGRKGSQRRAKIKRHVARLHEKIANSRLDTLHKFSTDMVRRFDMIYIEDLNVRGMLQNHRLARALSDVSLGAAARLLEKKAACQGKRVEKIDRWFPSSKTCSCCGHVQARMPLDMRNWTCPSCGTAHDRDVNAAVNILAVGQTVTAHGGTVRRSRATARERKSPRSANPQAATSG